MKKIISNETRDDERAYYGSFDTTFNNIEIAGPADGESAFKECTNIEVNDSHMCLRYPFWHVHKGTFNNVKLEETARAAFWYDEDIILNNVNSTGIKGLRECNGVNLFNCTFISPEFSWKNNDIVCKDCVIEGEYAFLMCSNVRITNLNLKGKYSFQYVDYMEMHYSNLDTKDAFWHSKNVTVRDTIIKGEYLGWYSENLTLINCKIIGTQPLCYCKNLTLIDCTTEDCDLAFEYSSVNGNIIGDIISIKNPTSGSLLVSGKYKLIQDEFDEKTGKFHLN